MAKKQQKTLGPVIATLNLKGGVGKTTVSAHVFRVLYRIFRIPTLLVDLDPQFNLSQTVFTRNTYDRCRAAEQTIMAVMETPPSDSLFEISQSDAPVPDPIEVSKRRWHIQNTNIDLSVVPGDFRLVKYSLMDDNAALNAVQRRFLSFVMACRQGGRLTVIDCNPSSSFLTICALLACTHILIPVRPDRYSVLGVELLNEFLSRVPTASTKKQMILLNGIPRQHYDRAVENELRAHPMYGSRTLVSRLHQSAILTAKTTYAGFATDKPVPHRKRLLAEITQIAEELGATMGFTAVTTRVNRWLYLLAGSGLTAKEIRGVCAWLKSCSPDEVVGVVHRLRQQNVEALITTDNQEVAYRDYTDGSVRLEIERILRGEARLSARAAALALGEGVAEALKADNPMDHANERVPVYGKESFQAYIAKLQRFVSPQVLLHIAFRIRGEIVHGPPMAWPLKR